MFLVRPLRMVSISLEHHLHRRPRLRQVELNPCKVIPLCTHPVLIIGFPASIRVRDANKYRRQRYSTSFRNVYDPLPISHSLPRHRHLPKHHHQDQCNLYYRGRLPHPRNAFPYRPYLSPSLTASGQIGFRRRQSTTYKLRVLPSMAGLERLCLMMATIRWRRRPKGTMRKNLMILVSVAAIQSCGQNGESSSALGRYGPHRHPPHFVVLHAWTRYFPGCYLLMGSRKHVLGHVTDVRVWRLYTLPRQYRCLAPGDCYYRIWGFRPHTSGHRDKGPIPPHRALMACYRHVLGALNVRHSQRHS